MAPVKRNRLAADGDDDDDSVTAERSSPTNKHGGRKKVRLSSQKKGTARRQETPGTSASVSSGEDDAPVEVYDNAPLMTQYEIDRDGDFEHLNHESDDDARATQKFSRRKEQLGKNVPAENGIILSVTMINFMCHERLHVTLGPLINFIIGENGSGKSAILTAITLCLGGKASTTNRGGSLKSFIKTHQESANLIIRLKNEGLDAYQPEVYGSVITVERHFTSTSSGFKLKNENNRIVSTKKGDVDDLIEYFQMQIDNPMNILSQDNARSFLTRSTAAQKFKFFVKGVQLEQLDNDYRLLQETTDNMEAKMQTMAKNVQLLQRAKEVAEEKIKIVNEQAGMRNRIQEMGWQLAWAQVEEEEDRLRRRQQVLEAAKTVVEEKEADAAQQDQYYQNTNHKFTLTEETLRQVTEALEPFKDEEVQAKERMDAATQELQTSHQEQREIKEHLTAAKQKAKGYQKDIQAEQRRIESANGGGHNQKLEELALAREESKKAKANLEGSSNAKPRLQDALQQAENLVQDTEAPIKAKEAEILACEERVRSLSRDAGHIMSGFDPKVSRLMNLIREDNGFQEKPVGPVGLHIKLLKPIWSNALERSIGNMLNSFIVTNKSDQQRLSGMMRNMGLDNCPVVIGNHHPIDTRGHEPDEQFDTVLRVLEIDNDLVRRQLIINQAIEQSVLIEDRKLGERMMYSGASRPKNVKQCFTLHPTRRGWGIRLGFMQGGGNHATSGPIAPPQGKPRMKTDIDSQIAYQKDTLQHLRQELSTLKSGRRELEQKAAKCSQALRQHIQAHSALVVALQRAEDNVERLQAEMDKDNVEDGRLEALKEFLTDVEEEIEILERSYGDAAMAKDRLNQASSAMKKHYDESKFRRQDHEMQIKKATDKLQRTKQDRDVALQKKNVALDEVGQAAVTCSTAEEKCNTQQERVSSFKMQAEQIHETRVSVPANMTVPAIEAKLHALMEQMNTYNKRLGGTDDEIMIASERAIVTYNTAEAQYQNLKETLALLKTSYALRLDMWRKFQRHISARARINFTYLLSERGFRGKLRIDHRAKLLDLNIEPDETVKSQKGRQTKTLSGGEKSFSNICLLLSLWEAMGAPLRCLDEFDVYMDQVNRDVSTKLIITAARRSVGRQYILITPNAIGGGAEHDADVTLIRLTDPRQTLLADL